MKKCPWCGKEYPDAVKICVLDHNILEPPDPIAQQSTGPSPPSPDTTVGDELPWQTTFDAVAKDAGDPAEFVLLRTMEPFEADRLLDKFKSQGIPFQIDRVEYEQVQSRGGVRKIGYIQVFVRRVDQEKADGIYTADWKV